MTPIRNGDARIDHERRTLLKAIPLAGIVTLGSGIASANSSSVTFPDVLPLPTGFRPEGIVTGRGHDFFVGSLAGGAIYRGNLRTGAGEVLVAPAEGRLAVGLSHDSRSNYLFVAGGPTGKAFVYDGATGETAGVFDLTTPPGTFVNDVVVTRTAAYFTDSFQSFLYRVPLGPGGGLPDQSAVSTIPLGGDFQAVPGFNANGIDAPPDAEYLIVVNSTTGLLYTVDPASGLASEIDLGGDTVTAGDGILLDGKTLYVVRNQFNEIAVVKLDPDATGGKLVGTITDPEFDVPTTVAEFGSHLYAVNARFGILNPGSADYDVVRVPKGPNR